MARIVMKFGGTSVADLDRIRNVARRVQREVEAGHEVAVVVSAMSGVTNQLVKWCQELSPLHDAREYDAVVATGEQVTTGLLAIALQTIGVDARSWQGWQVPIRTDSAHGKARVESIEGATLIERMRQGQVPIVAGFQGIDPTRGRITTLGRGGSDLSAVAIAAAVKADRCDIYTDVDGIYTTDPRIVPRARKLDRISYEEMLELASVGAKVLQTRSVELAMKQRVRIQVLSSFEDKPGSLVVDEDEIVEQPIVSGIAYSRDDAKITLRRVPDRPGVAAHVFGTLAKANVNVDMIVQNIGADAGTDMTFTVGKADLARAQDVLDKAEVGYEALVADPDVAKISVVGVGMRSHAGVANTMFQALADKGINIQVISTSEIKVSVLIGADYTELAVRALHTAYGLDGPGVTAMDSLAPLAPTTNGMAALDALMARGAAFFGARYALMGGAMSWVSERNLVAALSNAGAFGVLACGAMEPDRLAQEIAGTQALTQRPFGVNLITMHPRLDQLVDTCLEAKVGHIVFAGGIPPTAAIRKAKDGGAKVVCFAPALALAKKLHRSGADALVIEGSEAGGHIGPVSLNVLAQEILPSLGQQLPIFVAGGIGRGEAILAYLEMGAAGAQLGTRFVCATESIAHPLFKRAFLRGNARDAVPTMQIDERFPVIPVRALVNAGTKRFMAHQAEALSRFQSGELTKEAAQLDIEHFWAGALRRAVVDGDVENGSLMAGQSVGMVDREAPAAEIIAELIAQAAAVLARRAA